MTGLVINPPSISGLAVRFLQGMVGVVVLAALFTFFSSRFGGFSESELAGAVLLFGGIWTLLFGLRSLREPMLIEEDGALVVRRWGSALFHIGEGERYPLQALKPREVFLSGARGGRTRVVELVLSDNWGGPHRFRFYYISLTAFQRASVGWRPPQVVQ